MKVGSGGLQGRRLGISPGDLEFHIIVPRPGTETKISKRGCGEVEKRALWERRTSVCRACHCPEIQSENSTCTWTVNLAWPPKVCFSVVLSGLTGSGGGQRFLPFRPRPSRNSLVGIRSSPMCAGLPGENGEAWTDDQQGGSLRVSLFSLCFLYPLSRVTFCAQEKSFLPSTGVSRIRQSWILW